MKKIKSPIVIKNTKYGQIVCGVRSNSVVTMNAPSNKLCDKDDHVSRTFNRFKTSLSEIKRYDVSVYNLALVQLSCGCRVSEALNICPGDILINGNIVIHGAKGSNDRIVSVGELREWLLRCRANNIKPFEGLNRFYVYRVYKRFGLIFETKNRKSKAVTHSLRYMYIATAAQSVESEVIKKSIGHVSVSSTKVYEKNTKK